MPNKQGGEQKVEVLKAVNNIFYSAIHQGASDVHLEPQLDKMIVRYRIDGILKVMFNISLELYKLVVSRIKVMAKLDLTGLPRPQEGNIVYDYDGKKVDMRVSIFPTNQGEAIVVRILEGRDDLSNYKLLGFNEEQVTIMNAIIHKPYGLILVTGPTGSGKSTTLFTMLKGLNDPERSLVTLEDPIERKVSHVRQTQVMPEIGLTFAEGLRYLLRQDPDVIMVGEIRDKETASIAVQAAITGHLVLATIHTNNAAGAIVRLINMGIEPFMLASSLKFVSAQRLARKLCSACKEKYSPSSELVKSLELPDDLNFFRGQGCNECGSKGTIGRVGVHELLLVNKNMGDLILSNPSDDQINSLAVREGMTTLKQAFFQKVDEGVISLEEAIRHTEI